MPTRPRLLAPLRHPPFRLLFFGQLVSNIGDCLNLLALVSLLLYEWDLGAPAWGAVLTALSLPAAVFGPVAGVWADRWPRRTIMIVCDLARAGIVLGLVWAPDVPAILGLVGLASVFSAFFFPAQRGAIRSTVPEADLLAASSLSQLANYGARLVGPALGGGLVVAAGPRAAFVADSASFLLSAALLSRLHLPGVAASAPASASSGFWPDLRAGLACIRQRPVLLVAVGGTVALGTLAGATDALATPVMKALGVDEDMATRAWGSQSSGQVRPGAGRGPRRYEAAYPERSGDCVKYCLTAILHANASAGFHRR